MRTFERLKQTTQDLLDFSKKQWPEITLETKIRDIVNDSLDAIEFIMMIEEDFDIEINDEDPEKWITFQDLVTYIESKQ